MAELPRSPSQQRVNNLLKQVARVEQLAHGDRRRLAESERRLGELLVRLADARALSEEAMR